MRELSVFPLPEGTYRRSSGYGVRTNPVTGAPGTFHRGVDYAAAHGTPVYAPFDGQITTGYEAGGAGNWINLRNGPDMFKSFHHSGYEVRSGWVSAGQVIAYIGTTGSSTGAHGHFELWENGHNIDPTGYLDRAPVKGSQPAPAPAPVVTEEEDDVKVIIRDNNMGAWLCWGMFRRFIATQTEYDQLIYVGVQYKGVNHDFVMNHFTEIPRDRIV